ncbi:hypothetical protein GCM10023322_39920 [Rugosimonospora acidiphila]|uniref:Excreted virulence factor EspC, type VII ESX diderm n=1 Tax=Rugosimonospora acidiphila TaxID=556531 RepID=A0ABP9RZ35_9ACTN
MTSPNGGVTQGDPVLMQKAADSATGAGEGIALNLSRLLDEVQLAAPGFVGAAGSGFQDVVSHLEQDLQGMLKALNYMADKVNQTGRVFDATDAGARAEIMKVQQQSGAFSAAQALRGN